jgi:hypothetical protein
VAAGVLNINNSIVSQNFTLGINSPGGGIALVGGVANVTGSTITQNEVRGTGGHGGGIYTVDANLLVRNSTVVDNRATPANARGGGIYSNTNLPGTQKTTILNSTISGNTAAFRGGGVFNADGRLDIKHSTITNNSTPYFNAGSGVGSAGNDNTLTTVLSSIIAGNVGAISGIGSDVDVVEAPFANSFQSLGYNVVGIGNARHLYSTRRQDRHHRSEAGPARRQRRDHATHTLPAATSPSPAF